MARKKKKQAPTPPENTQQQAASSSRYRFFRWLCLFFFVAALFIRLDVITIWPGAEAWALNQSLSFEGGQSLPTFLQRSLLWPGSQLFPRADLFYLFPRLLSALLLLASLGLYYRWGSRLFGKNTVELQLMVVAASLWLPFFGKVAAFDSWAFFGQLGLWLSTLLLAQTQATKYQFYQGLFALLAALAAPLSTLLFLLTFYAALAWLRPLRLPWLGGIASAVMVLVVFIFQYEQASLTYAFFGKGGLSYGQLLLYAFLGVLPAIGFVLAGFRDLVFKWRQREALAITLGISLLAAFVAQSLLFAFFLAALAGKQLQLIQLTRYPWQNWVRGAAVVHLIFAFLAAFLSLMTGLLQFQGEGYRAMLGMAAAYWIFSLLAVLGLYAERRDFSLGGTIFAGLLATLFFWVQVYPFIEIDRSWPQQQISQMPKPTTDGTSYYVPLSQKDLSPALPYLRRAAYPLVTQPVPGLYHQLHSFPNDSTAIEAKWLVSGRQVLALGRFGWVSKQEK